MSPACADTRHPAPYRETPGCGWPGCLHCNPDAGPPATSGDQRLVLARVAARSLTPRQKGRLRLAPARSLAPEDLELQRLGLLEWAAGRLVLTPAGRAILEVLPHPLEG